jgi:hypothetical protein
MSFAFPDVCRAPTPPVPFPNYAWHNMGVNPEFDCIFEGKPTHTMKTIIIRSTGDEPGVGLGVASGTVMDKARYTTGAFKCLINGHPLTRLTDMTTQNNANIVGSTIMPSQTQVLVNTG